MHPDRPSTTAAYVAMGRALAHALGEPTRLNDPFALQLLPDEFREAVRLGVERRAPRSPREALLLSIAFATSKMMGPRTVAIDDGLTALPPGFQVVILGAGLDSRAHRLSSLRDSVVFEVDHPASQAFKRSRIEKLPITARELKHVAVDFSRDSLDRALDEAGHQRGVPTAWIWEGVVTYLTRGEIELTLSVVDRRSAAGSRLLATYNCESVVRRLISAVTARTGEPHRSWLSQEEMASLLSGFGLKVHDDSDGLERARRYGLKPGPVEYLWTRGHHVLIADRR